MKVLETVLNYIAPPECAGCGQEGAWLCADCISAIPRKKQSCLHCNALEERGRTCKSCRYHTPLYAALSAARYDGAVKELLHRFKYEGGKAAAKPLAQLLVSYIDTEAYDVMVSVPADPGRYRQRGYNPAALIAKELAVCARLPVVSGVLVRNSYAETQVGKRRQQRLSEVARQYSAKGPRQLSGARVLLVDDVITTGATVSVCAGELRRAGAKRVTAVAPARV